MGWSFNTNTEQTKAGYVKEITSMPGVAPFTCERFAVVGNQVWTILTHPERGRMIVLFLIAKERGGGWGYKDMTEAMHPYYYGCPLAFLEMVPETCAKWRAEVRAYHAKKAAARKRKLALHEGAKVKLVAGCRVCGQLVTEATITSVKPLEATVLNGYPVKLRPGLIAEVL